MMQKSYDFVAGEVLVFDKLLTWTSFDLVNKSRFMLTRATGVKKLKVGHAGTLDPLATGVMIVCTGKATKTIDAIQAKEKEYLAQIKLGATTPSFDLETEEDFLFPFNHITEETINTVLKQFTGNISQIPPAYSAILINGQRAYKLARKGEAPELKARELVIYEIEIVKYDAPYLDLRIVCSKGTYIRSLARDIGIALKSGGYLSALRRTRVGDYTIQNAITLDNFKEILEQEALKIKEDNNAEQK